MEIETVKENAGGGWLVNGELHIPDSDGNRHSRAVKEWIERGNTPEPADPEPSPPTLREQIIARLRSDPLARAQAMELKERRNLTNQQVLDLLEQKSQEAVE